MVDNVHVTWSFGEKDGAYLYIHQGRNTIVMTSSVAREVVGELLNYIKNAELHNMSVNCYNSAFKRPAGKLDIVKNFFKDLFA